ncbi:MAG: X2-like carbohydrate binding domain-containing protein, partial [Hungatella sp.]
LVCLGFVCALVSPITTLAEELAISQATIYEDHTADARFDGNLTRASASDAEITSGSETWVQPYLGPDFSIWKRDNSQIFSGITSDLGGRLIAGTDYSVIPGGSMGDEVLITNRYLKPFIDKTLTLTFEYEAGANPTVQVHAVAPEQLPIVDGAGSVWQQGDKNALSFT